jgi:hypothetical protein
VQQELLIFPKHPRFTSGVSVAVNRRRQRIRRQKIKGKKDENTNNDPQNTI